jgi:4-hydroxy-tetrahydrodipicolinate synthase
MPPYHGALLKADEEGVFAQFHAVAEAVSIPIMVQDAPLSGVQLSVQFLARLAREIPQIDYLKIETPATADKLRALIEAAGDFIAGPFDGEESITLMADLDAGATGTMCSALLPDLIKPVVDHHLAGRRDEAIRQYNRILPLINYENRQCGLRACKTILKEGGVIASDAVRHPFAPLPASARSGLLELARTLEPMALCWGR